MKKGLFCLFCVPKSKFCADYKLFARTCVRALQKLCYKRDLACRACPGDPAGGLEDQDKGQDHLEVVATVSCGWVWDPHMGQILHEGPAQEEEEKVIVIFYLS